MIQSLTYGDIKFDKNIKLREILNTSDHFDFSDLLEVDINYPDGTKEKI